MLAVVAGAAAIQLPGGAGDNVQYMPAAQADALAYAEAVDKSLPPADRQKQFFKNGIERIEPEDYYAHEVIVKGQRAIEYRQDVPVPQATVAQAGKQAEMTALGQAIAQGLADAMKPQARPFDDDDDDDQAPDYTAPQGDAKLAVETMDANRTAAALGTTVANVAASNSTFGAVNPAHNLTAESAATGTDGGNPPADSNGQPADQSGNGTTAAESGTDKTDTTDKSTDTTDNGPAKTDTPPVTPPAPVTPTVPSGRPRASRATASAAPAAPTSSNPA